MTSKRKENTTLAHKIAPEDKPVRKGLIEPMELAEEEDPFPLQSDALKKALQAVENMGKVSKKN